MAHRKRRQHHKHRAQRPVPPQQRSQAFSRRNHGDGQGNQHAQSQVGERIIVAAHLVLRRQKPTVEHAVYPGRVPQRVQIHREIPVQRLPAAGGRAIQKPQRPAQHRRAGQITAQKHRRPGPAFVRRRIFQQQRQRDRVSHGQKIRVDAHRQHVDGKQQGKTIPPLPPPAKIAVQRRQHQPLCPQRGMPECPLDQNRAGTEQQTPGRTGRHALTEQPA